MEPEAVFSTLFAGWALIFIIEYYRRGKKEKEIKDLKRRLREYENVD